ncbi:MAG: DUF4118 domain-containing protein, partial [Terracidiphilus sp.]
MDQANRMRSVAKWVGAVLSTAVATVLLVTLGANSTTAGLVFVTLVVWFSAQAGAELAVVVTVLSATAFDYYFLPPLRTLRIVGVQQWVAMVCFLASCAVVGQVAEKARRQARRAQERSEDVERLYTLAQEMMLHEDAAGLIRELPRMIARIFALDAVVLFTRDNE